MGTEKVIFNKKNGMEKNKTKFQIKIYQSEEPERQYACLACGRSQIKSMALYMVPQSPIVEMPEHRARSKQRAQLDMAYNTKTKPN